MLMLMLMIVNVDVFLVQVIVDDLDMGTVFEFPCFRWFSLDEDDGQISRELILNVGPRDATNGKLLSISVTHLLWNRTYSNTSKNA